MSIVSLLAKQSLIAQKNNLQFQMLKNQSALRNSLNYAPHFTGSNLETVNNFETSLALENISNESQLMAINAELQALNSSRLNYFA